MPRKTDKAASHPPGRPLSPNQVVAYNLIQARRWRNWTQQQAADPYQAPAEPPAPARKAAPAAY